MAWTSIPKYIARILCTDSGDPELPVVAIVSGRECKVMVLKFAADGRFYPCYPHPFDLLPVPVINSVELSLYRAPNGIKYATVGCSVVEPRSVLLRRITVSYWDDEGKES
mgnify:CR=1 FL=1